MILPDYYRISARRSRKAGTTAVRVVPAKSNRKRDAEGEWCETHWPNPLHHQGDRKINMLALRWREAVTLFNAFLGVVLIIITGVIVGRFADVRRTVCDGGDVTANSATQADGAATILDDSARFWSRPEPNVNYRDMLVNLMDAGRLEENSRQVAS